jgi:hypothetical protein
MQAGILSSINEKVSKTILHHEHAMPRNASVLADLAVDLAHHLTG